MKWLPTNLILPFCLFIGFAISMAIVVLRFYIVFH